MSTPIICGWCDKPAVRVYDGVTADSYCAKCERKYGNPDRTANDKRRATIRARRENGAA
ncbi:hypothetical protein [Frankia sp. Cas3]|uniref:hypothetical protein n=1 Tax=Frankia sp. Cas3 TaxID=3073926 RepID=UPI002AD59CA8|nr:hypothetical protein [Frankia sp. Cas3]